jgi:glycosyltransferase involved in cell wall biosynthesis
LTSADAGRKVPQRTTVDDPHADSSVSPEMSARGGPARSKLHDAARNVISVAVFLVVFWPGYVFARVLTLLLRLVRWHRWLPAMQARLGIRRRVLYLEIFFPESSGYVYRVLNWTRELHAHGFTTRVRHPLGAVVSQALLSGGWTGVFYAAYLLRRLPQCLTAPLYNCVVVRRELLLFNDYGNLFLERLLLALNPRVALDFDDDIGAAKRAPRTLSRFGRLLREAPDHFGDCLRLYPRFIAGSRYLRDLMLDARAGQPPEDAVVIPTCVDYQALASKDYGVEADRVTLGWIGTNDNLPLLEDIVPALNVLARRHPLRLLVIAGRDLDATADFPVENRRWSLETQIADLMELDVGLMPLLDTRVERGKCGFKLIQYMGLGIVGVASAVTTNCEIVTHGVDGFLVAPGADWAEALQRVLERRQDFPAIGAAARRTVATRYSFPANAAAYVEFVRRACETPPVAGAAAL